MSSTSVQAVVQPETYHIRSNLSEYLTDQIQKSLMATTNVELPDFQAFLKSLQNDSNRTDLDTFLKAVHWVHHLFLAHVKIAFLIHMREVHGIDMLCSDARDMRMQDHYFFINFTGYHLPNELVFLDRLSAPTTEWLESKLMLLTRFRPCHQIFYRHRVKIKCNVNGTESVWVWEEAPVVTANSRHASMRNWTANVRSMPLPNFPYEESSFMPVACATVQRVNMRKLCEIVKKAASQALVEYIAAKHLGNKIADEEAHREFPDRCFLTRRQQLDRNQWWNAVAPKLRQRNAPTQAQDDIEFNWGYEEPQRQRTYVSENRRWDQIDVRMHFFDKCMKDTSWKTEADGMWYIEDYADFMGMLQKLELDAQSVETESCTIHDKYKLPNAGANRKMPKCLPVHDRACHRFSVLSWFFDCRDAGACRYRWEDWVLEYFGAYLGTERASDFENFVHVDKLPKPLKNYFGKRWFEIVLFLEQNFRNAIAPMHYKLFEFENDKHPRTDTLQEKVKMLYQRQTSMLNNRSVFAGLQVGNSNGTSLLSFRRFDPSGNANMTLRERIMSQLHDELPGLDPFLKKYIRQFMIPDAELFLRMIRCPNVLALRELAVQHRHLLGGQTTASSVQQPYHLQQTLKFFPIAVQSEILYMLKFVECDDSVYVHSPAIHEAKLVLVPQNLMRQWIRETLEVAARVQTLQTPLQIKCYMFTMQELAGGGVGAFHAFKKLFYTTEAMMNYGSKRAIVFVLLQIRLALFILKNGRAQHSNPLVDLFPEFGVAEDLQYETPVWQGMGRVPWTPGACLECWPRRDLNEFVLPSKNLFVDVTVTTATTADHGRGSSEPFRGPELREIRRWVDLGGFLWTLC